MVCAAEVREMSCTRYWRRLLGLWVTSTLTPRSSFFICTAQTPQRSNIVPSQDADPEDLSGHPFSYYSEFRIRFAP